MMSFSYYFLHIPLAILLNISKLVRLTSSTLCCDLSNMYHYYYNYAQIMLLLTTVEYDIHLIWRWNVTLSISKQYESRKNKMVAVTR